MIKLVTITLLCSAAAPFLGGLAGVSVGRMSKRFNAILMSFTAGTMVALICFELLHEAVETGIPVWAVAVATAAGAALIAFLDYKIDEKSGHSHDFITCEDCDDEFRHDTGHDHCDGGQEHGHAAHGMHAQRFVQEMVPATAKKLPSAAGTTEEGNETHHHKRASGLQLLLAGLTTAAGVAIHNLPEGMTLGAMYSNAGGRIDHGLTAFLIALVLHNIPEGIAVALPLHTSGMSRTKAALIAALPGATAVIGAVAGCLMGEMGPVGMAMALSIAAGTLLYVVFGEILPQSINMYCSRRTAFAVIAGVAVGLLLLSGHAH